MNTPLLSLANYRPYLERLSRQLMAKTGQHRNKLESSDLIQEVMILAHNRRGQFHGNTNEEYLAWLHRILENKFRDELRHWGTKKRNTDIEQSLVQTIDSTRRKITELSVTMGTSPSTNYARLEHNLLICEALEKLPDDQRQAIELRHLEELSQDQVAKIMNKSKPAIAGLLRRGLKVLRQHMNELSLKS